MMKVDFHVHSSASDGTLSPLELAVAANELDAIALTDHDNVDGVAEFMSASGCAARRFAGIELSVDPGAGFDKFHLLGLGVDITNAPLAAFLKKVLEGRNDRNRRILANFVRIGIEIAEEDIKTYAHGEVLARPHFATWLVKHGYATNNNEAFERYLAPESPEETRCYEKRWHAPQEMAFKIIHDAGGICVMAHPKFWKDDWRKSSPDYVLAEKELVRLKEAGLDGLEALYQANTPEENIEFSRIALKLGLLKTAGSDYHGTRKPGISLGMKVSEDFIMPVIERLSK